MSGQRHLRVGATAVVAVLVLYLGLRVSPEVWPGEYGPKADDRHWRAGVATGTVALGLIVATLAVTPVRRLRQTTTRPVHLPWRRTLGQWAAAVAALHAALGVTIHSEGWRLYQPYLTLVRRSGIGRVFGASIWLGSVAVAIVLLLGLTSNDRSLRRLGALRWKRLHRLVYVAVPLIALHVAGIEWWEGRWWPHAIVVWSPVVALVAVRSAAARVPRTAPAVAD